MLRRSGQTGDGRELFKRLVFNALVGNGDDHARNHGILGDAGGWRLSPAYDLVPQATHSREPRLAMRVGTRRREASVVNMLSECGRFGLDEGSARRTITTTAAIVGLHWEVSLRARGVPAAQIAGLARAFLNPGIGLDESPATAPRASPAEPRPTSARRRAASRIRYRW